MSVKGLLLLMLAVVAAVAMLLIITVRLIDPEDLALLVAEQASAVVGAPVEIGATELSILPMPSVRVRDIRVGSSEAPLAQAEEVRLRVSLLSALLGRVVLSSLEVDAPILRLELDADGRPRLPAGDRSVQPPGPAGLPPPGDATAASADDSGADRREVALAIRKIRVTRGEAKLGPWRLDEIELDGSVEAGLTLAVSLDARLVDVGDLRDVNVRVEEALSPSRRIRIRGRGVDLDVTPLVQRLIGAAADAAGRLDAEFDVGLEANAITALDVRLSGRELELRAGDARLQGDVPLRARLDGGWSLDLSDAEISVSGVLRKPRGELLAVEGVIAPLLDLAPQLEDVRIRIPDADIPLEVVGLDQEPGLRIDETVVELAPVSAWLTPLVQGLSGRLRLGVLQLRAAPLELRGDVTLEDVSLELGQGVTHVSGPLRGVGDEIEILELIALVGEQPVRISGLYALTRGEVSLRIGIEDAQAEPMIAALRGQSEITGTLDLDAELAGPPRASDLTGQGTLELRDGELRGFSLLQQVLGGLAAIPILAAEARGKDLSEYDHERFETLAARFRLAEGRVHLDPLTVVYRSGTARLTGSIGLSDLALDLGGELELSRDVDEALAGRPQKRPTVIPIEAIRGTLDRPRVIINPRTLARIAAGYATSGRMAEKLEEHLGKEGAAAVQDVLEGLLGRRKRQP